MASTLGKFAAAVPALLATLYTQSQPAQAKADATIPEDGNVRMASTMIKQEVVQVLWTSADRIQVNVAGDPGVHFRVLVSSADEPGTFTIPEGGEAILGNNGFGTVAFDMPGRDQLLILVHTSDDGDFASEYRTMAQPLELLRRDDAWRLAQRQGGSDQRDEWDRTPTATAGVRG